MAAKRPPASPLGVGPCLSPGCKLIAVPGESFCFLCLRRPDVQMKLAEARAMAAARLGKFAGST